MGRIILGLSVLLMLVENGFAKTDAEYDKQIKNAPDQTVKEMYRCNKTASNHPNTGDVNICIKSLALLKKNYPNEKGAIHITTNHIGVLYDNSEKNHLKAYEYFMKAAKLGNTVAQKNLDILCRQHSWVCK